jgi:hypothetical protein
MTLAERLKSPTPKFFKTIRKIGLSVAAIGGALLAAPVGLPVALVTVAGGVMTAVAQAAVENE